MSQVSTQMSNAVLHQTSLFWEVEELFDIFKLLLANYKVLNLIKS